MEEEKKKSKEARLKCEQLEQKLAMDEQEHMKLVQECLGVEKLEQEQEDMELPTLLKLEEE